MNKIEFDFRSFIINIVSVSFISNVSEITLKKSRVKKRIDIETSTFRKKEVLYRDVTKCETEREKDEQKLQEVDWFEWKLWRAQCKDNQWTHKNNDQQKCWSLLRKMRKSNTNILSTTSNFIEHSILNTLVIQGWIMKIEWDGKRLDSLQRNWIMKSERDWIMNDFTRNWTFWEVHFVERQELSWRKQKISKKYQYQSIWHQCCFESRFSDLTCTSIQSSISVELSTLLIIEYNQSDIDNALICQVVDLCHYVFVIVRNTSKVAHLSSFKQSNHRQ